VTYEHPPIVSNTLPIAKSAEPVVVMKTEAPEFKPSTSASSS